MSDSLETRWQDEDTEGISVYPSLEAWRKATGRKVAEPDALGSQDEGLDQA